MLIDNNYQKYFIVNGQHIGDYETMYRNCQDPWRIEELGFRLDMRAALLLVDLLPDGHLEIPGGPFQVLDAGAGAGLLSGELLKLLARKGLNFELTISDISETALERAKRRILGTNEELFSSNKVSFTPFDLRQIDSPVCPWPKGSFDLIFLAQVLWGLVENIEGLFPGLCEKLKSPGHLIFSQHFPGSGRQSYAAFLDPDKIMELAEKAGFRLLHTLETDRTLNHHWAALWTCC